MRKTYENVKESFGMGEGPHFAQEEITLSIHNKNIVGSKGIMPLAGSGAEPRLNSNQMTNLSLNTKKDRHVSWF